MKIIFSPQKTIKQFFSLFSLLTVFYLISVWIIGKQWMPGVIISAEKSHLFVSIIKCIFCILFLQTPLILKKALKIDFPGWLCIMFYTFCLCATTLGETWSLYDRITFWDDLLHCTSGFMSGVFGFLLAQRSFTQKDAFSLLSPAFCAAAAFCTALTVGALWEIYEFSGDCIMGMNMQRFSTPDGIPLIGQSALCDTMKDLIVDLFGAVCAAVSVFIFRKKNKA